MKRAAARFDKSTSLMLNHKAMILLWSERVNLSDVDIDLFKAASVLSVLVLEFKPYCASRD